MPDEAHLPPIQQPPPPEDSAPASDSPERRLLKRKVWEYILKRRVAKAFLETYMEAEAKREAKQQQQVQEGLALLDATSEKQAEEKRAMLQRNATFVEGKAMGAIASGSSIPLPVPAAAGDILMRP